MLFFLFAALIGCDETTSISLDLCEVTLIAATPESAAPGESVTLTARPLTESWDTALYVGGARAELLDVTRLDCDDCDECREDNGCTACGDCDACDADCESICIESAAFVVPALDPGATTVQLFNSHGSSLPLAFEVDGSGDTGAGDSGDTGGSGDSGG